MLPEWEIAFDNRRFSAFGRTLEPLSLGHLWNLQLLRSPLVVAGEPPQPADILLAVFLSSIPHTLAPDVLRAKKSKLTEEFKTWGTEWGARMTDGASFVAEAKKFAAYFDHDRTAPKRWGSSKPQRDLASPWIPYLVTELTKNGVVPSLADAWALRCCEAFAHFAMLCEAAGDDTLKSERDEHLAALNGLRPTKPPRRRKAHRGNR